MSIHVQTVPVSPKKLLRQSQNATSAPASRVAGRVFTNPNVVLVNVVLVLPELGKLLVLFGARGCPFLMLEPNAWLAAAAGIL
jgi:hypothetical protein